MTHAELIEIYENDQRYNDFSLREYKLAKQYYHGNQLPSDVKEELESRGQSPIIENIYKMIVNKILGYKIQSIQEVKVSGRQEQDKALANLLNDLLKVFSQSKDYDKEIIKRDKDLIFGLAVCEVWVSQDKEGDYTISLRHIPADCFLIDCFSTDGNASDATRFHRRINLAQKEAKAMFGNDIYIGANGGKVDSRVSVIESWILEENKQNEKVWNRYCWNPQGKIYSTELSPFKNGTHPYVIAKYNIDEQNRWYGLFRDIKPLQDYINFAENRMANMMGSIKAFFEEDAVIDAQEFAINASYDNAIVKVRSGALKENKIHFVQHHADIQALSAKTNEKRNLAKILSGLNDEALGVAMNRQSGVAIAQRRDAGLMGLQDFIKAGDDMDKLIFAKALEFITMYFTKKQTFKIVDKKVGERYFSINATPQDTIKMGKFDVIYKSTMKMEGREERFAHWSEMIKTIAQIRPDIIPDLLPLMLKDTDSPIIEDLEEILATKAQEQAKAQEAQAPIQQKAQELELAKLENEINEAKARANKYNAQSALAQITSQEQAVMIPLKIQQAQQEIKIAKTTNPNKDFKKDSLVK